MAFAQDLLLQAKMLCSLDRGKPKQANLRRAVSASYYALFHLLTSEAAQRLSPTTPRLLSRKIARAFTHADMKAVCRAVASSGSLPSVLAELRPQGFSAALRTIAESFVELQDERHDADYNLVIAYSREEALELVDAAQNAFNQWRQVRTGDEANVFLAALLLHSRWAK